jgi:hypothetical protein
MWHKELQSPPINLMKKKPFIYFFHLFFSHACMMIIGNIGDWPSCGTLAFLVAIWPYSRTRFLRNATHGMISRCLKFSALNSAKLKKEKDYLSE